MLPSSLLAITQDIDGLLNLLPRTELAASASKLANQLANLEPAVQLLVLNRLAPFSLTNDTSLYNTMARRFLDRSPPEQDDDVSSAQFLQRVLRFETVLSLVRKEGIDIADVNFQETIDYDQFLLYSELFFRALGSVTDVRRNVEIAQLNLKPVRALNRKINDTSGMEIEKTMVGYHKRKVLRRLTLVFGSSDETQLGQSSYLA
jgi:hypothetical protein